MITLTEKALEHIKKMIARRDNGIGFRLSIKQTGCTGYMYVPEVIEAPVADDIKVLDQDGIVVYLDPACQKVVAGTEIDFVQKAMGMEQLVFNNPNVDSLCGCGESFNLKENNDE